MGPQNYNDEIEHSAADSRNFAKTAREGVDLKFLLCVCVYFTPQSPFSPISFRERGNVCEIEFIPTAYQTAKYYCIAIIKRL